ncbi:hypothetical protein LTR09_003870 [Extremus antarcticus]|uniref:2EXR domain-containing protein n=1 Tax=Extremus antarcticus TaxID=702011 RepID=A0AAJ0GDC4_9PEZI|nr:hypothetical protein LTR09_003870 [Extremus antarcticus]
MAQTPPKTFLDLPAELRNKIYELVLPSNALITIGGGEASHQPDLTMVNRQFRRETLGLFYARNRLDVRGDDHQRVAIVYTLSPHL